MSSLWRRSLSPAPRRGFFMWRGYASGRAFRSSLPLSLPPPPLSDRPATQFFIDPLTNLLQLWSSREDPLGEKVVRARAIRAGMIRIYARIGVVAGCLYCCWLPQVSSRNR